MKCMDLMTPDPKMCKSGDSVSVPINMMWDYDCGAIPVVKDFDNKELVGMITDRDIAMYVVKHAAVHPSKALVSDCMSKPVVACQLKDELETAMQLMGENQLRRLPIIDQSGSCVGIISEADLISNSGISCQSIRDVLQQISTPHAEKQKSEAELPKETAASETAAEERGTKKTESGYHGEHGKSKYHGKHGKSKHHGKHSKEN